MQKLLISFLFLHVMTISTRNLTNINLCKIFPESLYSKLGLTPKNEDFYSNILKNDNKEKLTLIKRRFEEFRKIGEQIKQGYCAHYESDENGLKKHIYIDAASQLDIDSLELGCLVHELNEKSKAGLFYFNNIVFKVTIAYEKEDQSVTAYKVDAFLENEEIEKTEKIFKEAERRGASLEKNIYTNLLELVRALDAISPK